MKYDRSVRIRFIAIIFFLSATIIISRLFFLQVVRGEEFKEIAERQYTRPLPDIFSRGSIFFKEKNGNLISTATLKTNFIIAINPSVIIDPENVYESLSPFAKINREEFFERASKKDDPYEVVGSTDSEKKVDQIKKLNIKGVSLYRERSRFYPANRLGSHILGFVSRSSEDGNSFMGRYGLERQYEDTLKRDSESVYINFFAEIFSSLGKTFFGVQDNFSGDIVLSIEPTVEDLLSAEVSNIMEKLKSESAGGIIMDPATGKIVAMSSLPDFDPNNFGKERDFSVFKNPLVESVFEMGSTIKPITVASGIDAGIISSDTTYNDKGFVEINGRVIKNYDGKARGVVDIQTALSSSLNLGMIFIMQQMGRDKFSEYFLDFGLGERTGIDLPSEARGLVNNLSSKYEVDYATASFGQGIAVTPIATARALSALANGGLLVRPTIVDEIKYRIGASKVTEPKIERRVISPQTSEEITRMLVRVVDEKLLEGSFKLNNYSVAAKTGTALLTKEGGGYHEDRYLHSFFGYFPAYNPKFLIFLYTVDPQGVQYASHSLTEPFFNMVKFLISYYEIHPDR